MMKIQCQKIVTKIQWDLRLLGKDALPIDWAHLWLQSFGAFGCCSHILHCVLASQKHLGRIVTARKFAVFRVVDVLCGVWRNCIQTALVAADRLDLFSKCGQKVSTYALTCFNHVLEKSSTTRVKIAFESFKGCLVRVWTVNACGRNLENSSRTLHLKSITAILSLSEVVSSIHSDPYNTLLFTIGSKTRIFHLMVVRALSQNTFNLLHIAIAAANLLSTSRWLFALSESALSESSVPKYIASCSRGTGANRWVPHVVLSGRRHLGTRFPARGPRYTLAT